MKKTWEAKRLALSIEWQWRMILRGRKTEAKLINSGVPLTSIRLEKLERNLSPHFDKVMTAQRRYGDLTDPCP